MRIRERLTNYLTGLMFAAPTVRERASRCEPGEALRKELLAHERTRAELAAVKRTWWEQGWRLVRQRDIARQDIREQNEQMTAAYVRCESERDAALAKVAELELAEANLTRNHETWSARQAEEISRVEREGARLSAEVTRLTAELEKRRAKMSNLRRALRSLNKSIRSRAETIRSVNWVNGVTRADHVLDSYGKLTQRNQELGDALGQRGKGYTWSVMLESVRELRGQASDLTASREECARLTAVVSDLESAAK